jgi:hypothetical protein
MRLAVAAAGLAAFAAAAQDTPPESRWGPVAENLGAGSGICLDGEDIVCAVVLCEKGALALGILGTDQSAEQPAFRGRIDVDGQAVERDMQGQALMDSLVYVRTPLDAGEPLWRQLRAGNRLSLPTPDGDPIDFSLRGSSAELQRVASSCR